MDFAEPADIVPGILTHILYCFADVSADTGAAKLTDSYADEGIHYPGDSWSEPGNNVCVIPRGSVIVDTDALVFYGAVVIRKHQAGISHPKSGGPGADPLVRFQLYLLKLKQRNLKVLLSVGGWTYSQSGHFGFVTDASKRSAFVTSAVTLVEDYGFDGMYTSIVLADFGSGLIQELVISISNTHPTMTRQPDTRASLPSYGPPSTNWHPARAIPCLTPSPYEVPPQLPLARR